MADHAPLPPINFAALADALLARVDQLLPDWLPGGVKRGHEYVCGSVYGGAGSSCSVNTVSGLWSDFQSGEAGKDLISLYAAGKGIGMGAAAVAVAREEGLEDVAGVQPAQAGAAAPRQPRPVPVQPASASAPTRVDEGWATVTPVPSNAPAPTFKHGYRQPADLDHTAVYTIDGNLYGYVVRFRTSDGGKETLPYTWCTSARDGASKWHWRTWDEPRPLYFPGGMSPGAHAVAHPVVHGMPGSLPTVVLVEGEKKAGILQTLLDATAPGVYLVASWPGGCKAWKRSDWAWLAGCVVLAWPDCDGKREPLTKKEREACLDEVALELAKASKPVLPAERQPGMVAMLGIGALLRDAHACTVQLLPIPEPLSVVDGWDCADAINVDGWDGARVLAFFGQAQALPASAAGPGLVPPVGAAAVAAGKKIDGLAEAGEGDDAFLDHLMFMVDSLKLKGVFEIGVNRKLVITALRKAPALGDCLGFNELTGAPSTRLAWPWRAVPGPLKDTDDLALGDWLCDTYKLKPASRATLSEAIETVADQRRFHPIRDWLKSLEHDGKARIDKWLIYVLGMEPDRLPPKRRTYLEMVGRFLLLGLVARVMQPGCKFDYSPVFEGLTGRGKSTFVKTLVGAEFFSDTHFDIGNGKDGFEQLEGLWGYELSELTALRKADSEQVKQFFSSTVDRFRGAYGKYVQAHPRQCVIFCSTNKKRYLYDLTGNRRFWPIWIDQLIKLDWLVKYRSQLFAEAYALFCKGERYAPTLAEEEEFFVPEQKLRLVETAVQSRLYELLTRVGAPKEEGKLTLDLNQCLTFVTLDRLVSALGADAAKSSSLLEGQIRGWLEANGWTYGRESTGQRRRGYRQPKVWPPVIEDEEDPAAGLGDRHTQTGEHGGSDDEPF
jgi:putative DNA primase/helicase